MALIRQFERVERDRYTTHEEIDAKYMVFERDGKKLIQIDTFGRGNRELPGKQSQTLQFDYEGALALFAILKKEFGFS
jgi:hypothetical protein